MIVINCNGLCLSLEISFSIGFLNHMFDICVSYQHLKIMYELKKKTYFSLQQFYLKKFFIVFESQQNLRLLNFPQFFSICAFFYLFIWELEVKILHITE